MALHQVQKVCRKRQDKVPCSIVSINVVVLQQCGHVVGCTKSDGTAPSAESLSQKTKQSSMQHCVNKRCLFGTMWSCCWLY